jgi:hypothetical protein
MELASFILRSVLTVIFLAAAFGKATQMRAFTGTLASLGMPRRLRWPLGAGAVLAEALAVALLWSPWLLGGLALLSVLNLAFIAASLRALALKEDVSCSCFGRTTSPLGRTTIVRALLLQGLVVACSVPARSTGDAWWPGSLADAVSAAAVTAGLLVLGRWLIAAPLLASLVRARGRDRASASPVLEHELGV